MTNGRRTFVAGLALAALGAALGPLALRAAEGRVPGIGAHGAEDSGGAAARAGQAASAAGQAASAPVTVEELNAAIDRLGSFDFDVRTAAGRTVRRAAVNVSTPLLARAARSHKDEYVRYRALVILAGLGESAAGEVVRDVITDRNDRLRTVSYGWYEHHPDPAVLPTLLAALSTEQTEFVRPTLTRAIAAQGTDPRAQAALVPLVARGADLFRGAVIEALGDYKGQYALPAIIEVAKLDGPLQDDAITAMGKLGDLSLRPTMAALQKSAPPEGQPTISAALCLLGIDCPGQRAYLLRTLAFAAANQGYQPLLRGVVHGFGMLAMRGDEAALNALFDAGVPSQDPARAPIALGVGVIALRNPQLLLKVIETRKDFDKAGDLLQDAFDMLSEDYEEERFYVEIRKAFYAAPEGSARKRVAQALIDKLEF